MQTRTITVDRYTLSGSQDLLDTPYGWYLLREGQDGEQLFFDKLAPYQENKRNDLTEPTDYNLTIFQTEEETYFVTNTVDSITRGSVYSMGGCKPFRVVNVFHTNPGIVEMNSDSEALAEVTVLDTDPSTHVPDEHRDTVKYTRLEEEAEGSCVMRLHGTHWR